MRFIATISIFGVGIEVYLIVILIGVPLFFIWRKLFRKRIQNRNKRTIAIWLTTLLSAPIVYTLIATSIFLISMYYPNRDFDRGKWINDKDTRYEYVENIIKSKMLIGKTKAEVKKLLGDEGNEDNNDDWFYDLGFTPWSIDPDSMEIEFENGKVASVVRHEHH